ncbi:MAG: glycosyltransferase family 4 protein [Cyanobacteriota bacterium]
MRILYITPVLEHPPAGGPQLRIESSIKALSEVSDLVILYRALRKSPETDRTSGYYSHAYDSFNVFYDTPPSKPARILKRITERILCIKKIPHLRKIRYLIKSKKINAIWFGYGNISFPLMKALKKEFPDIPFICDTDSVWSRFILRELPFAAGKRRTIIQSEGNLKEIEEREWVQLCEVTTAVSDVDADYYRGIAKDPGRIHIFSNAIDVKRYQVLPSKPQGFVSPSLFLAGTFWENSPMSMATQWVVDEVLPIVRGQYPGVHLYIVGMNSDREFASLRDVNITVTGKVESVLPYLCHSDVALVPLRFESGTRFKILEAGACKVPVVSTTLGAEGLPVTDGKDILIADEPHLFAAAIIKLFSNPELANQIAVNCYDLVLKNNSISALRREALSILEYLQLC